MTIEIQATGVDQYMRWWLDGVLVWDDSGQSYDYPVPTRLKFFGNFADSDGAETGSIFFDDLFMWKR